jgi:nucleoside-diphosphate kinase
MFVLLDLFMTNVSMSRTCVMLKPDAICAVGKIIECILSNGFLIKHMRMCQLSWNEAEEFYKVHKGKPFYE